MTGFEHITTPEAVAIYQATHDIFTGLIREIRELSKKKPDATLNAGKVEIINRVLADLLSILRDEPEAKFLHLLKDDDLPQTSDAVLIMVQFETSLSAFYDRYYRSVDWPYESSSHEWITPELVAEHEEEMKQHREALEEMKKDLESTDFDEED